MKKIQLLKKKHHFQNKLKILIYIFLISSFLFSIDVNYSLESKYGESNIVKFSDHILDINTTYDNRLYINTQFEYSDPPLFGENITGNK